MTRRSFLLSVPMLTAAPRMLAQAGGPALTVRALSHMTLTVSDRKRSLEFYQGLFGWPVQHNQGTSTGIRIGSGPQYVSLSQGGPNAKPGINHICMTVDGWEVNRIMEALARHGVAKTENAAAGSMKTWVRMRGEDAGGAKEGTPELYVNDPDGIRFQLQDPRYCGGAGILGEVCQSLPPLKGLLVVRDYHSFTLSVSNQERSRDFYQALFGMPMKGRQGSVPMLGVGSGPQRLLIDSGGAAGEPRIAHACLVMDRFDPNKVQNALSSFGVKPGHEAAGAPGPLVSYVRVRSKESGGARGGTPELFFTDPDGILIQLQDAGSKPGE
jgi:catechol 2,3-dioxygenase-like lactoylglutathione lyase family enzyme